MDVQLKLRSDIAMALDDCTPYPATEQQARESMELTTRWARQSREAFAQQHAETLGHAQARSTLQVCFRPGQLEREERVTAGSLMKQTQVGRGELSFQALPEELS